MTDVYYIYVTPGEVEVVFPASNVPLIMHWRVAASTRDLSHRIASDGFFSAAKQAHSEFNTSMRDMFLQMTAYVDPLGVANTTAIAVKVIRTICRLGGSGILEYFKRVSHFQQRDPHRQPLESFKAEPLSSLISKVEPKLQARTTQIDMKLNMRLLPFPVTYCHEDAQESPSLTALI